MSRHANSGCWYDVMQACLNGHIITSKAETKPRELKKHCPRCGEDTITQCPKCKANVEGYEHNPFVGHSGPRNPPAHCHECGEPYPWTRRRQEAGHANVSESTSTTTNKVFVVHGHDEEMKQAASRSLEKLGLIPIVLHEQPNQGRTLIDKFEKNAEVQFAVVLLSPDDMAYQNSTPVNTARPRPRQNVILELGYFVGLLTRRRVFALKRKGELELPTDISGVVYTDYDDTNSWQLELVRELQAAGYDVDANALL